MIAVDLLCSECSIQRHGKDFGDFKGLCIEGETKEVYCERCGLIDVDHLGVRVPTDLPSC